MTDTPSPGRATFRSMMGWLVTTAGCIWPSGWSAADDAEEDAGDDARSPLPVIDQEPKRIAPMRVPARTPKELEAMRRTDAHAPDFFRLAQVTSAEAGEKADQELLELAKEVGWLHTTQSLPALQAVLAGIGARDPASRPALIKTLADAVKTFPPQGNEDYEEPTADQAAALEALLQATESHVAPEQWPAVIGELREALGKACNMVGYEYMGLTLEEVVAETKSESRPRDMTWFLERLNVLDPQPKAPTADDVGEAEAPPPPESA